MSDLKKKAAYAFLWDYIGRGGGQLVRFAITVVLARLLMPEDFGLVAMVTIVVTVATVIVDSGMGLALIQRQEVTDKHYSSAFVFNILLGFTLALILFLSADAIGRFYEVPIVARLARVMSLMFIISAFGNVQRSRLRKMLSYKVLTQADLLAAVLSGIVGISMAYLGFGLWSLIAQSLLTPLIANIFIYLKARWSPKLQFDWMAFKDLWSFGSRIFLSRFIDTLFINSDSMIIGKIFGQAQLGLYGRAKSLINLVVQYSAGSLENVLLPVFSQLQDDSERLKQAIFKFFHLLCLVVFFLTGLLYVTGEDIIIVLFTAKWSAAIPIFKLLILCCYVGPLGILLMNILGAKGNAKDHLKAEIIKKVLFVLTLIIGFQFGLMGYLYGYVILGGFTLYINIHYASREIGESIWYFWRKVLTYLSICAVCIALLYLLDKILNINHFVHMFLFGGLYTCLYFAAIWLFRVRGGIILQEEMVKYQIIHKIKSKLNVCKKKYLS